MPDIGKRGEIFMPSSDLVKTGISGLDEILSGGIPRGNAIAHSPLDAQDQAVARETDRQGLGLTRRANG
jgi:hypothetical protein